MTARQQPFGCAIVAAIAVLAIIATNFLDRNPGAAPVAPLLSDKQRAGCNELLSSKEAARIVKARPSANRIDVEERRWAQLPATDKRAMLALVVCAGLGISANKLRAGDYVVAYGYRSGKRLAMLTSVGMSYE